MIPLQVRVKGFLSYADEQILNFDGVPLWMLTGPNGAGKSTIFDAITMTLYDTFRGHQQDARSLINQSCNDFTVEFDFHLGEDTYRARRIVNRKGNGVRQVWHLAGPRSPRPGRGAALVAEGGEVDDWVAEHIGLSYAAFTASVLLQQGRSDVLLNMKARERHDTLSQLIDLSAYLRLHQRSEEHWKASDRLAQDRMAKLATLLLVDQTDIDRLIAHIETLRGNRASAQADLEDIVALKVHAERWHDLQRRQRETADALARAEALLRDADAIERAVKRFTELSAVLPGLEQLLRERQHLAAIEDEIREDEARASQWAEKKAAVIVNRDRAENDLQVLQQQHTETQSQYDVARDALAALAPDLNKLEQLTSARQEFAKLEKSLADFSPGLDRDIAALQEEVERLSEAERTFPWLGQFAEARSAWHRGQKDALIAEAEIAECAEQITQLQAEEANVNAQLAQAAGTLAECASAAQRAGWEYENTAARLSNLSAIEGRPTCPHCGQRLTPEHVERERQTLAMALSEADASRRDAHQARSAAAERLGQIERQRQDLRLALAEWQARSQAAMTKRQQAEQAQAHATRSASAALAQLPGDLTRRIAPIPPAKDELAFQSEFPTPSDLQTLQKESGELEAKKRSLDALDSQRQSREGVRARHDVRQQQLRELEQAYPPERECRLRADQDAFSARAESARAEIRRLNDELARTDRALKQLREQIDEAETQCHEATIQVRERTARRDVLRQTVAGRVAQLPAQWQPIAGALNDESLARYRTENERLASAPAQLRDLEAARQELAQLQRTAAQLQEESDRVPAEARLPLNELQVREGETRERLRAADEALSQAQTQQQRLELLRDQRTQFEQERAGFARQAQLYKELSQLLGRDGLQKHLLEQVERAIVENANAILGRISGGLLRLEFQPSRKGRKPEASEIVVYHRTIGPKPIPVRGLSGGQRFRVAVSLALGIGRYAAREGQQVESVIIDEGFGSLDKRGRQEMIDALHDLSHELRRIIVVSHEDDFARGFANRYDIQLQESGSRVALATTR